MLTGTARQAHSAECHLRMEERFKGHERFKLASKREAEFAERAIAAEDGRMKNRKPAEVPAQRNVDEDMHQSTPGASSSGSAAAAAPHASGDAAAAADLGANVDMDVQLPVAATA